MTRDLTEGHRIYAVGDIHGRLDLLTAMLARIRADIAARPHPSPRLILLGDYIDRGPDSRGVLEGLIALKASDPPTTFLLGNHDSYIAPYLQDPDWYDRTYHWLADNMGGNATLASYGVPNASAARPSATRAAFAAAFPPSTWRSSMPATCWSASAATSSSTPASAPAYRWTRRTATTSSGSARASSTSTADFGFKVVHGHTIVPAVEHHPNRIAIDTGAVRTGNLSCLLLEGDEVALLTPDGPRPLPEGSGLTTWRTLWLRR